MTTQTEIISKFKNSIDFSKDIPITNWEENDKVEFKQSLQTNSETIGKEYLKTICAFANNSGGVIIFGICPDKKELVGIKPHLENLDNRYVSTTVTKALDGSFSYSFFTIRLIGKIIGFLYIGEATVKPVILKVDAGDCIMGEIYFRYPAQTNKICASDLRRIINEEIANRLRSTIGNISKLVAIGDNAAILNTFSGEIELGNPSTKLIIDETILNKLNLIKEGHFVDNEGLPAYVIRGQIESHNVEFIDRNVPSVINESDILEYFFNTTCEFPETVIERLVYSQSPYNPIHYFIKEAKFTKEQATGYIENLSKPHVNQSVKDKILERIKSAYPFKIQSKVFQDIEDIFDSGNDKIEILVEQIIVKNTLKSTVNVRSQIKRTIFYNLLVQQLPISDEIFKSDCKCIIEAFSNLKKEHLLTNKEYYLSSLKSLTLPLEKHNTPTISLLRKVICLVDEVYYYES